VPNSLLARAFYRRKPNHSIGNLTDQIGTHQKHFANDSTIQLETKTAFGKRQNKRSIHLKSLEQCYAQTIRLFGRLCSYP
jgi:hypothetical protein